MRKILMNQSSIFFWAKANKMKKELNNTIQKRFKEAEILIDEYENLFVGPGIIKKIRRLIRFRFEYITYLFARFGLMKNISSHITLFGILRMGKREIELAEFFIKNIHKEDIFYDIGANEGFFSKLLYNFFGESIEVHSFEPSPDVFARLKSDLEGRNGVFLKKLALSDTFGTFTQYIPAKDPTLSGTSTLLKEAAEKNIQNFKEIMISATTLDLYVSDHKLPTFIKMDVEGYESYVIRGGVKTLSQKKPIVAMEVWSGENGDRFSLKAVKQLIDLGYVPHRILSKGEIAEITYEDVLSYMHSDSPTENFVFIAK
mgnify:CR=1 FL=1